MSDIQDQSPSIEPKSSEVIPSEKPSAKSDAGRGHAVFLTIVVAICGASCLGLIGWSWVSERENPQLFYALSPVTALLICGVIQVLLFNLQNSKATKGWGVQGEDRQFRFSSKLLAVAFALGVVVPLIHLLARVVTRVIALELSSTPYQSFHEAVLVMLAIGLLSIIGVLTFRVFRLDE